MIVLRKVEVSDDSESNWYSKSLSKLKSSRKTSFTRIFDWCSHCIVFHRKYSTIVKGVEVKKQRYQCKACKIPFADLTNIVLYRTRRLNQWIKFVECMIEGYSLRKSAELVGNVSHVTLFYWRHKLLDSGNGVFRGRSGGKLTVSNKNGFFYVLHKCLMTMSQFLQSNSISKITILTY